jgi:hypothetical protein
MKRESGGAGEVAGRAGGLGEELPHPPRRVWGALDFPAARAWAARYFFRSLLESYRLIRWNVLDGARNPVKDHVVWEPIDCLDTVVVVVGITDPNHAQILILR